MGTHFFIDETKAKSYVVVAVACPDSSLSIARRAIGQLVLPGQRSIHMKHESSKRRGQIADAVAHLSRHGLTAIVLDAGRGPEPEHVRRDRALRALLTQTLERPATHLVLDLDASAAARDARTLSSVIASHGATEITFSHQTLAAQSLLSLPDVVAWCWARGGDWRRRVGPIVASTLDV